MTLEPMRELKMAAIIVPGKLPVRIGQDQPISVLDACTFSSMVSGTTCTSRMKMQMVRASGLNILLYLSQAVGPAQMGASGERRREILARAF
jgi:hypothetical protein